MRDNVVAALKKLGPSSPTAIANELNEEPATVGYHLRAMLAAEEVKASGRSKDRLYALPDQKLEPASAPPQGKRALKKKKSKARAARSRQPAPRAPKSHPAAPSAALDFLTAMTADSRLVIVNGTQAPLIFSEKESEQIAELCLAHFED